MYTQDLEAGLVMFMVDNCHNLLNLGHKLAHLSHMNMEKFNPLTCSFSLQYHPWVTCKGHEKKGSDQQQKKLLIFIPILLVSTFGYMFCIRQTWKLLTKFFVVPFLRWLTHGNQALIVRSLDNSIHWRNLYLVDNAVCFAIIYSPG